MTNLTVVPVGGTAMDVLAERYRTAFDKMEGGREQWIEGTLDLAAVVAELRKKYPAHQEFSRYLERYKLQSISANDRAALLGFHKVGRETARKLLERSKSERWRNIWENKPQSALSETRKGRSQEKSGSQKRKYVPDVMRDDIPSSPPTPSKRLQDYGLTREQVDPDFKGTPLEFVTQFGHVNLQTKVQIDHHKQQDALNTWLGAMTDLARAAQAMLLALPLVDPVTLQEWTSKPPKAEKLRAWCETIRRACEALPKT